MLAAAAACPLLRVAIAMRSDFYGQWPQDEASVALLRSGHSPVEYPGQAALKEMIVGPARAAGLAIDRSLVNRILEDTGTAPGALALAEYPSQLYDRRDGNSLTEAAYARSAASQAQSIASPNKRCGRQAKPKKGDSELDEEAWSRLFLAIAGVEEKGEELAVVRRRAPKPDLAGGAVTLAEHLVDTRILVSSQGMGGQPVAYEVAHEAVFSHWERFKEWYARYGDDLALRRQAERAAADWERADRLPTLRWGWERQKPVLQALRKLEHLPPPAPIRISPTPASPLGAS